MNEMLGRKLGMTRIYEDGRVAVPVTLLDMDDCYVVSERTDDRDGYSAVQLAVGRRKRASKPLRGHLKKAKIKHAPRKIAEVEGSLPSDVKIGDKLAVDAMFKPGDKVNITGWTKGRGFAGGVKRHGWHGGKKTHGSNHHRRVGSAGQGTTPGHLWKGRSLPGHFGTERRTVRNLKVVKVDAERHLLFVKGSVPGPAGSILFIRKEGA